LGFYFFGKKRKGKIISERQQGIITAMNTIKKAPMKYTKSNVGENVSK
jgi:hypothetical protein